MARVSLGVAAVGAAAVGQPVGAMFALLGAACIQRVRIGAPRYPLAFRGQPAHPQEAALLAMVPNRLVRRVDPNTYIVEPDERSPDRIELWRSLPAKHSEAWFDLELGAEPRVAGHAELAGRLLDADLLGAADGDALRLRGRWLGWSVAPADLELDVLVERIRGLAARLPGDPDAAARARDVVEAAPPLLRATVMLGRPRAFERTRAAAEVRPSWRWLARETGLSRDARLSAVRFLARCGDAAEVLDLLDRLAAPRAGATETARAAAHLADPDGRVQVAAASVLERFGTRADEHALLKVAIVDRGRRAEVQRAVDRALRVLRSRHGAAEPGTLAVVDPVERGGLTITDDLPPPA